MNSVLCLSWVRKAAAKEVPDRVQLNSEDLQLLLSHDHGATKEFLDEETDTAKPGIPILPVYISISNGIYKYLFIIAPSAYNTCVLCSFFVAKTMQQFWNMIVILSYLGPYTSYMTFCAAAPVLPLAEGMMKFKIIFTV